MRQNVLERLLTGATAGLLAAYAMTEFQKACLRAAGARTSMRLAGRPRTDEEVMTRIAARVARGRLTREQRKAVGKLLHYGFGATAGAAYAVLAGRSTWVTKGFGTGFATSEFAIGEILAPQELKPTLPGRGKAASEIYEWLTHVVYGASLEAGRRGATKLLEAARPTSIAA
jgi:hypothetical protein